MCDVESPRNPNSASMIGCFDTYSLSGLIVSTLLVGLDFDAHSLWILVYATFFLLFFIVYTIYDLSILCGLVLSHQLSASSNHELEPSGL